MSDKKYATRMHEVLGVETGERFTINEEDFGFVFRLNEDGYLMFDDDRVSKEFRITYGLIRFAIMYGITRRPRLSEEQVKQLKALHKAFGVRYAHNPENADCMVVFSIEPLTVEERMEWDGTVVVNDCAAGAWLRKLFTQKGQVVDIVQTLRDAGVEVEG